MTAHFRRCLLVFKNDFLPCNWKSSCCLLFEATCVGAGSPICRQLAFFFFPLISLSFPENYSLTFFIVGILTSVFIFYVLFLTLFVEILFVFNFIIHSQFTKYYIFLIQSLFFLFLIFILDSFVKVLLVLNLSLNPN